MPILLDWYVHITGRDIQPSACSCNCISWINKQQFYHFYHFSSSFSAEIYAGVLGKASIKKKCILTADTVFLSYYFSICILHINRFKKFKKSYFYIKKINHSFFRVLRVNTYFTLQNILHLFLVKQNSCSPPLWRHVFFIDAYPTSILLFSLTFR